MSYPKILFININFRNDNSAGITISKLITQFPRINLALLSPYANISDIDIFGNKFQLTNNEAKLKFSILNNRKNKHEIQTPLLKDRIIKRSKRIIKAIVGSKIRRQDFIITEELKRWLFDITPDYIYLNPDKEETIILANKIADLLGCKIIIHVMDDKVHSPYHGLLGYFNKKRFNNVFADIVNRAEVRLSISEKMSVDYKKRYKKEFYPFHNPVNLNEWNTFIKSDWELKKEINIIYSGFIGSTAKPIMEFCNVIKSLNNNGYDITFTLYSKFNNHNIIKKLQLFSFVKINDYVEQAKLPKVLTSADLLFLPLSFEKRARFTKFSMPTKTAEYMISGVPVIVYAPKDTALSEYAQNKNWALVLTTNHDDTVKNSLKELLDNKEKREQIVLNALSLAKERHLVSTNSKAFKRVLLK